MVTAKAAPDDCPAHQCSIERFNGAWAHYQDAPNVASAVATAKVLHQTKGFHFKALGPAGQLLWSSDLGEFGS